jgi:hypothetical protein
MDLLWVCVQAQINSVNNDSQFVMRRHQFRLSDIDGEAVIPYTPGRLVAVVHVMCGAPDTGDRGRRRLAAAARSRRETTHFKSHSTISLFHSNLLVTHAFTHLPRRISHSVQTRDPQGSNRPSSHTLFTQTHRTTQNLGVQNGEPKAEVAS